jgi:alkanesulfonate monooxygenase SsuD/methylene tetrahydromethanopterin reductase-like flavin-dependent oxidoreductase (luciferase family)
MTGELADGWVGTSFMPEHADVFFKHLAIGAAKAGRKLSDIEKRIPAGAIAFGDDLDKLIEPRKTGLAFSLGAMGSRQHNFYNDAYRRAGYEEAGVTVQRLWLEGDHEAARAAVPDEMVVRTNLLGTEAMVKERLRAYRDCGTDVISVVPTGKTLQERLDCLGRLVSLVKDVTAEVA